MSVVMMASETAGKSFSGERALTRSGMALVIRASGKTLSDHPGGGQKDLESAGMANRPGDLSGTTSGHP